MANSTDDVMKEISEERKKRSPSVCTRIFSGRCSEAAQLWLQDRALAGRTEQMCDGRKGTKEQQKKIGNYDLGLTH